MTRLKPIVLSSSSRYKDNNILLPTSTFNSIYDTMRYETEKKIIAAMNKLFNEESEDILQKNKSLQEEVLPLKKEIESLKKSLKWCSRYKDLRERLMPLINELVKDWVIHDNSGDCWGMTEYWPQWERWIKYWYKWVEYDIDSGSL